MTEQQLCVFSNLPPLKPVGALITNHKERSAVLARLAELYGCRTIRGFPGSQPVSIESGDIETLHSKTFKVSLKSDGHRYLLLMMILDGEPRAVMISRRLDMHEIESIWAPQSYFEKNGGTLLDGELVWEQRPGNQLSQLFLIFDIVAARERLTHLTFSERLTRIHRHVLSELPARASTNDKNVETLLCDEDKMYLAAHKMRMAPKRFVPFDSASDLWSQRGMCLWKNDGLIFMSDDTPLQKGTDRSAFKWKPVNSISIDIAISPLQHVMVQHKGVPMELSSIELFGTTRRVVLENNGLVKCVGHSDASVLECTCTVDETDVVFTPIKYRLDKTTPNDIHTVTKTLENVLEAIDESEIFGVGARATMKTTTKSTQIMCGIPETASVGDDASVSAGDEVASRITQHKRDTACEARGVQTRRAVLRAKVQSR